RRCVVLAFRLSWRDCLCGTWRDKSAERQTRTNERTPSAPRHARPMKNAIFITNPSASSNEIGAAEPIVATLAATVLPTHPVKFLEGDFDHGQGFPGSSGET